MFGFMKSTPPPPAKQNSVDPKGNPFDSDDDSPPKGTLNAAKRTSSEPMKLTAKDKERYRDGFQDSGGLENQSVQELENYAVYKSEETTSSVNNCLRIAENIREDAAKTLDTLHAQGDQIERTHNMCVDMDKDLSKGEKLLNSLGGMFSKPWKPKKTRDITGPLITADKPTKASEQKAEQREKLGLNSAGKGKSASKTPPPEPTNAMQKVELEKAKQDDALSDLSDILGDLKGMAVDMGSELDRQNKALDHLGDDVDELNSRVKGANQRARKLLQ
ncbi:hypothetical protein ACFE04_024752 [Oxalis oulophora]